MGADGLHTEGIEEHAGKGSLRIGGEADEEENYCRLQHRCQETLRNVFATEMTNFMRQNRNEFFGAVLGDEGIEQSNFFRFAKTSEKGIRLGRTLLQE